MSRVGWGEGGQLGEGVRVYLFYARLILFMERSKKKELDGDSNVNHKPPQRHANMKIILSIFKF